MLPDFHLRSGQVLSHSAQDDGWQLFQEIFVDDSYRLDRLLTAPRDRVVLDVGANIGFFSIRLGGLGARVHAFEPGSAARSRLERNVRLNGLTERVTVHPFAVSDYSGEGGLALRDGQTVHGTFLSCGAAQSPGLEPVQCVTLGDAIRMTGAEYVDLLKVDVEGAEIEIFTGASREALRRIRTVVFEYHDNLRTNSLASVRRVLDEAGFEWLGAEDLRGYPGLGVAAARSTP